MQPLPLRAQARAYPEPLLDRIHNEDTGAGIRALTQPEKYIASLQRDLLRLLSTRREDGDMLDPELATVLDYGIPSFTPMNAYSDLDRLSALVVNAIAVFEPRLIGPQLHLRRVAGRPDRIVGELSGSVRFGAATERFRLELSMDAQAGLAEMLLPDEKAA